MDVTVEFSEETLVALDAEAVAEYGGDRSEAAEALLAEWLEEQ
ncbi:MAG: ribbon-helix-helix protein, CopG family [Halobacteriaceae archaeon]